MALAACAVALTMGISHKMICEALNEFEGINRRFQNCGELITKHGKATLIDDYAHHPAEIQSVLSALDEAWPQRRKILIFQPHRFSRTQQLFDEFCEVLSTVSDLIILDIYSANENPISGIGSAELCRAIRKRSECSVIYVKNMEEAPQILEHILRDDDLVVTMGAGSISTLAPRLLRHFRASNKTLKVL